MADPTGRPAAILRDASEAFDSDQCGRKLRNCRCFRVTTRMIYVKARMAALRKMEGCGSPLRQLRSTAILNSPSLMRMGRTRWSFRAGASWAAGSRRRHAAASTCIPRIGVTGRHHWKSRLRWLPAPLGRPDRFSLCADKSRRSYCGLYSSRFVFAIFTSISAALRSSTRKLANSSGVLGAGTAAWPSR